MIVKLAVLIVLMVLVALVLCMTSINHDSFINHEEGAYPSRERGVVAPKGNGPGEPSHRATYRRTGQG